MTTSSSRPDTAPGEHPAVATACGKVILLGEHSVVYGEPAMAVPLPNLRLSVVLASPEGAWSPVLPTGDDPDEEATMRLPPVDPDGPTLHRIPNYPRMSGDVKPLTIDLSDDAPEGAEDEVSRAFGTAARSLGVAVPLPVRIAVRTGGLMSGMGTSAALGTALARALMGWYGDTRDGARTLIAAGEVERLFHNNPSGIDHTVSALEKPVWFEKDRAPVPLEGLPPLDLVLLPRRSTATTAHIVGQVRDRLVSDPSLVRVVAEMGRWTREGREAWAANDRRGLGEAMTAQHRSLDRLGVVNDLDRAGVEQALAAGALAAKITGAGWGGTLLALVTEASAESVAAAWGDSALRIRVE
jgi:mevalonate kinase